MADSELMKLKALNFIFQGVFKGLILIFIGITFSSCTDSGSTDQLQAPTLINNSVPRPKGDVVLSRDLLYKNDSTITYCESANSETSNSEESSYSGYRDLKPYALASVSKVFLSAWALYRLGPDYRFQMIWKLKKISNDGVYDAYLQTNYDPIINTEKIKYAISLLNQKGVHQIRNLTIDETTRVYSSVLSNPHLELSDVPVTIPQTVENLSQVFNLPNSNLLVQKINYLSQQQIQISDYSDEVRVESAILLKYLKDLNVYSNNYVADALFDFLGGAAAFKEFQFNQLSMSEQDLIIYTGSGLSTQKQGVRFDNLGSCLSVLKILKYLDFLSQKNNLNLGHVLLTAGLDHGTYESEISFDHNVVLKTGRLFDVPTLNIAGVVATLTGHTYFSMMAHDFENSDESIVKIKRDHLIADLLQVGINANSFLTLKLDSQFYK